MDSQDEKPLKIVLKMKQVDSPRRALSKRSRRNNDLSDDSDTMDDLPLKVSLFP